MRHTLHMEAMNLAEGLRDPQCQATSWPCGLMDKALVFGTKDCRFESCQGHMTNCQNIKLTSWPPHVAGSWNEQDGNERQILWLWHVLLGGSTPQGIVLARASQALRPNG